MLKGAPMARKPLVSVVVDNYNYARYLGEAIESALAQSYAPTEVIVVDDGSTDGSRDVIAGFGQRMRPVLKENGGQASAFNAGAEAARGDVICFLDSDDAWRPEKVERVVQAFEEHPEAGWLRHRLEVVDAAGRPLGAAVPRFRGTRAERPHPLAVLEGCFPVPTSAMVLRRSVAERVFPLPVRVEAAPGHPELALRRDADVFTTLRAAALGEVFLSLDEVLGVYRRHPHQTYPSAAEVGALLEGEIRLGGALGSVLRERQGRHAVPSSVFKHQAVLAGLRGAGLLSRERLGPALDGVRALLPLLGSSPALFARQAAALAFGVTAPRAWVRKLIWHQGFTEHGEGAGDGG
jgi:CTP:molybdopterin cytidylyltransferase MocA